MEGTKDIARISSAVPESKRTVYVRTARLGNYPQDSLYIETSTDGVVMNTDSVYDLAVALVSYLEEIGYER